MSTEVLNPFLYTFLEQAFGPIKIANKGRGCHYSIPPTTGGRRPKGARQFLRTDYWGEGYRVCCPLCGDTRHRLFFCHAMGCLLHPGGKKTAAWFSPVIAVCHNEGCHKEKAFKEWMAQNYKPPVQDLDTLYKNKTKVTKAGFTLYQQQTVDYPAGCRSLLDPDNPEGMQQYLLERRFDPTELAAQYMCRYGPTGCLWQEQPKEGEEAEDAELASLRFHEDRLIIPIIQRRRMVSWQARLLYDGGRLKYLNPPGSHKSSWLYNMDRALLHRDLVICEGVTDVWRVGENSVALFGKHISEIQMSLMKLLWGDDGQAIVLFDSPADDPDAKLRTIEAVDMLNANKIFPRGAWAGWLEKGDPASTEFTELQRVLNNARSNLEKLWKRQK